LATAAAWITSITMRLNDRAVIALSGPEARDFLQGLVTNDIRAVAPARPCYAALLTPQGKVLFDFLVSERDGVLLLDCPAAGRDALVKRLALYRLRAKVEIVPRDDLAVVWREDAAAVPTLVADPRHPGLGARGIVPAAEAPSTHGSDAFETLRLDLGVPEGRDFGQDKTFALDADLDELHAIAFEKGCYVGQELTARMKHRGTARKRLLPIAANAELPAPETPLRAGDRELGALHSVYGTRGFALLRLDRLEESKDVPVTADGIDIRVARPDWLFS
jgi:tRNA-modifying protein YgfZ